MTSLGGCRGFICDMLILYERYDSWMTDCSGSAMAAYPRGQSLDVSPLLRCERFYDFMFFLHETSVDGTNEDLFCFTCRSTHLQEISHIAAAG